MSNIIARALTMTGALHLPGPGYTIAVYWASHHHTIHLDGVFTAGDLRALANYMEAHHEASPSQETSVSVRA